jgi:serine/threonine-protein kinase
MPFGRRVWGIGKALLLMGALGLTFVVFFFGSMRVAIRAGQVQIPDLVGLTAEEANRALQELDLRPRFEQGQRADAKVAAGRVAQQDPPGGEEARPQRTVKIWLSSGPRTTPIPALVGQTERTARIRLDQDGVTLQTISEMQSADYPGDSVVAQEPAPPARAPQVSLLLNREAQAITYVMPDVIGMDGTRVESVLRNAGLRVTIVGSQTYPGIPAGTVVRQQPPSGYEVGPADAISLEVSR